jgi:uncharacterized protein (DUF1778 family)
MSTSPASFSGKSSRRHSINLRIQPEEQALIDRAAQASGKTRTEFILAAARSAAIDALLDRCYVELDEDDFARFQAALAAPPKVSEQLRQLMQDDFPWMD